MHLGGWVSFEAGFDLDSLEYAFTTRQTHCRSTTDATTILAMVTHLRFLRMFLSFENWTEVELRNPMRSVKKNLQDQVGAIGGCLVAQGTDGIPVPALSAKVVDTTGAGDCWDGGFIAALAGGEDLLTAARIGNACAAFSIEAAGGSTGVPTYGAFRQRAARGVGDPSRST